MTLRIDPHPTFEVDVQLTVPGQKAQATVRFTFKHRGARALRAWTGKAESMKDDDAAWLGEVIAGWSGPEAADGSPIEYSPQALANLLDAYPASGIEIHGAYMRAYAPARLGN